LLAGRIVSETFAQSRACLVLFGCAKPSRRCLETHAITREAGDYVKVEVEEVLIARRVVVLPQRDTISRENVLGYPRDSGSHG
jgi:hypothetical protein